MAKMKYARYKFTLRKGVMICSGQKQTRRGTYFPAKVVNVPMAKKSAAAMEKAMAQGVKEINGDD